MRSSVVLPAPLSPSTTTLLPRSIARSTSGEDLLRPVGLAQPARRQRRPAAGRGLGEPQPGDLVRRAHVLEPGQHPLGAARHVLRGDGLGGLGAHLVGLREQRGGLLLGVGPLAPAALLVRLALLQVGVPAEVVLVELAAVGVQVEHLVHRRAQQVGVVADDDEPAGVRAAGSRAARGSSRRRGGWSARPGAGSRRRRTGSGPARRGGADRRRACRSAGRARARRARGSTRCGAPRSRRRTRRRR